ncbi:hypothetical protein WG901_02810 [Novosphingobium sp. PS1R-30]|uniref:Lipoprotein n=1 Tax=Novosphingobium anseongense TaxID=3133436 RepID=A0ABU8RRD8_9SPHN|nr:MAG: hypothetical protein EOO76_09645 [Novosphingobium sp.]
MSRSAGNSWRVRIAAVAMLLPMLTLGACAKSNDEAMNEKLAAAEAAANKAIAAQKAAENAAAVAAASRPAPAPEPTPPPNALDEGDGSLSSHGEDVAPPSDFSDSSPSGFDPSAQG